MADAKSGDQDVSCLRALGAAIFDAAEVGGSTGVVLRRALAEFVSFTTKLEEEVAGATPAQVEQTLKAVDNFHRALGATRASLEKIVIAANDSENLVSTPSVDSAAPNEQFLLPAQSPDHFSMVSNFTDSHHVVDGEQMDDEAEEEEPIENCNIEKRELECPECEYRSNNANDWVSHLKTRHSTAPILAGYILRCDCGNESYSEGHSNECDISNYTVIRTKVTPQCVCCEKYPATTFWYALHLMRHHKTTLDKNGIYLLCSCGFEITNDSVHAHREKCEGREFSMHRLEEG